MEATLASSYVSIIHGGVVSGGTTTPSTPSTST